MTRTFLSSVVIVALIVIGAGRARAHELNLYAVSRDRPNIVSARTGMEGGIIAELGYRRVFGFSDRLAFVGFDVSAPVAELDAGDYRVQASLALPFVAGPHWKLVAALGPTLRSSDNALNRSYALGADARVTGGYYAPGWFVAAELGSELIGGAYIRNSNRYRRYVYSAAQDGWYRDTGGSFYLGAHAGLSFAGVDLVLRLAHARAWTLQPKNMPFFATAGVNAAF